MDLRKIQIHYSGSLYGQNLPEAQILQVGNEPPVDVLVTEHVTSENWMKALLIEVEIAK